MRCSNQHDNCPLDAVYAVENGSETSLLCELCFKDYLFDIVKSNDSVCVVHTGIHAKNIPIPQYTIF